MPIFEYHCNACGRDFELIIQSAREIPECPECKSGNVTKKFSAFAVSSAGSTGEKCAASEASPCAHGGCGCGGCCHH